MEWIEEGSRGGLSFTVFALKTGTNDENGMYTWREKSIEKNEASFHDLKKLRIRKI